MTRPFRFKKFTVVQERTPMKVGTDGVLLGAWAHVDDAREILDIGTGTGLLALMAVQRAPRARVTALEPHPDAAAEAQANFDDSPFRDRITLHPVALEDFFSEKSFDLILCNPPYFSGDLPSPDSGRTAARHAHTLTPHALAQAALHLAPRGRLASIYPVDRYLELEKHMAESGWKPLRRTFITPLPDHPPHRVLSEFSPRSGSPADDRIAIRAHSGGPYSAEYKRLTAAFYLDGIE